MKATSPKLMEEYQAALCSYLAGGGEVALQRAYELGRSALSEGLGVLEIAALHHEVMVTVLSATQDDVAGTVTAATKFFVESLSPFEMAHRGYREANAALRASEERFRELFENANDVVFTTDLTGNFTSVNRAGEQLTGYRRDETPSMNFSEIAAPEYLELVREELKQKIHGGGSTTYELEVVTKSGQRVPLEVSTRLIYREGRPVGVQGIARDVSERKRAQEALRRLNERLEEEARRIAQTLHDEAGQLLASVYLKLQEIAHDLPAPAADRLKAVRQLLDPIAEQLRRLSHELRPTILDDLGLLPALEFLADGVSKRSVLSIAVRGSASARLASTTEIALYRIVQEALTNVTKHARATRVSVDVLGEDGRVRCSIRDDGIGFDVAEVLARRGKQGLGLIGIRERVDALRGTLQIVSAPGQGTELVILVPLEA